jgi:DNA-binding NtrC family response regulator
MNLVADRFVVDDDGRAIDLTTGAFTTLSIGCAGGVSAQVQWVERCDALRGLCHRSLAPLIDFGVIGEASRFEAWQCGAAWRGAPDVARAAGDRARQFLEASGLSVEDTSACSIRTGHGGLAVVMPGAAVGYSTDAGDTRGDSLPISARGLSTAARSEVAALAEMLQPVDDPRPRVAALWGPPGSGKSLVVQELARLARLNGFVPVQSRLIDAPYADLWNGRSLFIVHEAGGSAWTPFLRATLRATVPHVLLIVGHEEVRSVAGVGLGPLRSEALCSSIRPQRLSPRLERVVRRAAVGARGVPGRFARLLWPPARMRAGQRSDTDAVVTRRAVRVAEQTAVYGAEDRAIGASVARAVPTPWPLPGELAALRRSLDGALDQIARGRHAPGIRQLRRAIGGLARRGDWTSAGDGALALARALLRRGRTAGAQSALAEAREFAVRTGREALLVDVAIASGEAWTDLARLDEAEGVLAGALVAAGGDAARVSAAAVAMARCLFWRGRYDEAALALDGAWMDDAAVRFRVGHAVAASRIAVGQRDFGRAVSLCAEATEWSRRAADTDAAAAAAGGAAFAHLALGDLDAVNRCAAHAIAAARAAHDPLGAVRARLILAASQRWRGRVPLAQEELRRMTRIAPGLSPIIRARCELLNALTTGGAAVRDTVDRHIAARGLKALALYAPDAWTASPGEHAAGEVVTILQLCQAAEDESVVLAQVCARLRRQLHAGAVAFVALANGADAIVAADGGQVDLEVARRALAAGIAIAPHRSHDRVASAVPVMYAGAPIGALCARWALGAAYDVSRAAEALVVAATAAAPMLSVLARRAPGNASEGAGALLGLTPCVGELRCTIERASAAPFAVLIQGESGSGKELVARAIHRTGPRRDRTFSTLNCAALPDDLVEAELFGHTRGAFTGAVADRRGVFEEAHGGTLFLDEVGELSARAQAKVLRVIQEGELRRLGETVSRRVDVRIVSATNRDLPAEAAAGRFRLDLLYRLDVIRITVPALRERREDIAVLAEHFWRDATSRVGSCAALSAVTLAALARYDWPGNVRELQNVLASLAVRSPKRGVVPPTALPPQMGESRQGASWRLEDARRTFEERFVRAALVRSGGHRGRAAGELGVTRQGLTKLMGRLRIATD